MSCVTTRESGEWSLRLTTAFTMDQGRHEWELVVGRQTGDDPVA